MENQFLSPEGDLLGKAFVNEEWIIDRFSSDKLWVWGTNSFSQLADIIAGINKSTPVTTFAGGNDWKQISSGSFFAAAIKSDGTLWTWGRNNQGQLGINNTSNIPTPVTTFAGGSDWKQVSCGTDNVAAIKTDGTLWVWGYNNLFAGILGINDSGNNSIKTPVTTFAGGANWKQVSCGKSNIAAIKTDGSLWIWGTNSSKLGNNDGATRSKPITTFAGGNNWKQVSCGFESTAAIKTDGTLWIWGQNSFSQLGTNDTFDRSTPITTFAGGNNWKQVEVSNYDQCISAIKTDGTLWTWGRNANGLLATNDLLTRSTPVTTFAGGQDWKNCSPGYAVKKDGSLWVWGTPILLGINNGSSTQIKTPVTTFAGGNNWKQVSSGGNSTYALSSGPEFDIFSTNKKIVYQGFGQAEYTTPGTYSWTCPVGVTTVCVVCVGAGGRGGGGGGGGGGLGWKNNITVTPGTNYTVVVGQALASGFGNGGDSYFINTITVKGGGGGGLQNSAGSGGNYVGSGGGNGGSGSAPTSWGGGGGGAGGYSGNGGNANTLYGSSGSGGGGGGGAGHSNTDSNDSKRKGGAGGGVGIYGQGASGAGAPSSTYGGDGGSGGSGGTDGTDSFTHNGGNGGLYGGGSGATNDNSGNSSGTPGHGAVRIIWGPGRAFPSTLVGDL